MDELWDNSWLWALPLIVLTVMLHVVVLGGINARVVRALQRLRTHRRFLLLFVVVMGITTLLATLLHGVEALLWACAYHELHALPDIKTAVVYSLGALDDLWARRPVSGHALAAHGCAGGPEWPLALWPHDRVPLLARTTGLADRYQAGRHATLSAYRPRVRRARVSPCRLQGAARARATDLRVRKESRPSAA